MTTDRTARHARALRSPAVLGYATQRSVRAGAAIDFCVSTAPGVTYLAQLVRLSSPDIGPIGPPFKERELDASLNGRHDGRHQPILPGSYASIEGPLLLGQGFTIDLLVEPTLAGLHPLTIFQLCSALGPVLFLRHSEDQGLVASFEVDGTTVACARLPALRSRAWTDVAVSVDLVGMRLELRVAPLPLRSNPGRPSAGGVSAWTGDVGHRWGASSLMLAAERSALEGRHDPSTCFNGKIERVRVFGTDAVGDGDAPVAAWDFSVDVSSDRIHDVGPSGLHGQLHNLPTRGTRGSEWSGDNLSWVAEPAGYAAIHFHEDDLADARWAVSHRFDVPVDLPSGCYAVRLQPLDDSTPASHVPFFVRPAAGAAHSGAVFLVPTTTYGAYANMHLRVSAQFNELAHGRLTVLDSTDLLLLSMPELEKSTYDVHTDGSPVVYSSMNRPVTNFRPTGRMYKFCLDLMIVDWLDAQGFAVDIVTDDDLHAEGIDALAPYRVVITGSHPEYITRNELDAIQQYVDTGGRLMYLGGNGFYNAAEIPAAHADVVEVRRPGLDNLWRVNHTEGLFSSSGRPAGLWRNIGRTEQSLVGVGFLTQGFDECTFYTRSAASTNPRVSWIFDGLDADEVIGDFGVLQGGAAGYEIDRHDIAKGSPGHSLVLASSAGHSPLYDLMVSSLLDILPDPTRTQDPIRADMVFFETNGGGAVFSVGSIAWAGSLSHNHYVNSVSTVTRNVFNRFLADKPFIAPPES